jgi:polysaccharide biosynthesis protein PslH
MSRGLASERASVLTSRETIMNVLMIDEEVPFPPNTGKRIRTYNLIKRLGKRHNITYLCYENPTTTLPELKNVSFVQLPSPVLDQKGILFYISLLKNIFSTRPYSVDRHTSGIMSTKITSLMKSNNYDLIHCEWTPYTENLKTWISRVPSVLSAHNIEAQIWHRYFKTERNGFKKLYTFLQWKKMDRYERQASKDYSEVMVVSEPDKELFLNHYGRSNVTVVPNGIDQSYFLPLDHPIKPYSMVFSGSMDWRPNQDGVHYFLKDIFPLIKKKLPEGTVVIAGRNPPRWLEDLSKKIKGVCFTGTVDDVRPYISQGALYIVPLRIGGGSRLKILEALAMGKIVLSTSMGSEGLNLVDGEHLVIRDRPEVFASTAVDLMVHFEKNAYLGVQGREKVLNHYTWDSIVDLVDQVWARAIRN